MHNNFAKASDFCDLGWVETLIYFRLKACLLHVISMLFDVIEITKTLWPIHTTISYRISYEHKSSRRKFLSFYENTIFATVGSIESTTNWPSSHQDCQMFVDLSTTYSGQQTSRCTTTKHDRKRVLTTAHDTIRVFAPPFHITGLTGESEKFDSSQLKMFSARMSWVYLQYCQSIREWSCQKPQPFLVWCLP